MPASLKFERATDVDGMRRLTVELTNTPEGFNTHSNAARLVLCQQPVLRDPETGEQILLCDLASWGGVSIRIHNGHHFNLVERAISDRCCALLENFTATRGDHFRNFAESH